MITNQIMKRQLGNFVVEQRTKDAFFNATSLLKQWNDQPGVPQRSMDKYFESSKTVEFIRTIMERENLHTPKMVYVKSKARAERDSVNKTNYELSIKVDSLQNLVDVKTKTYAY